MTKREDHPAVRRLAAGGKRRHLPGRGLQQDQESSALIQDEEGR
jgi:hypothetical protein